MTKKIVIGQDQVQKEVEMTAEEEAQFAIDQAESVADVAEHKALAEQEIIDGQNANQKLLDLGLTQPEINALKGISASF